MISRSRTAQRKRWLAVVLLLVFLGVGQPTLAGGQGLYRILVTNDDGIESSGLEAMVERLAELGEVVVAAPADDRSYAGFSKTIPSGMLRVRKVKLANAVAAFSVQGTPADAVHYAILAHGQEKPFDAVVAGVNRGSSLGHEALSIGIIGAALAAASYGLPAIAVAQDRTAHVYDVATGVAAQLVEKWFELGLPEGTVLSINVPASASTKPGGVVIAPLGGPEYDTMGFKQVMARGEPSELWRVQFKKNRRPKRGTDLDWYQRGEVTITPISLGVTDLSLIEELAAWQLVAERSDG